MRLLIVMANYPFPPLTGSSIIAYNSMKHLSSRHLIDLICLKPTTGIAESAEFVERVEFITQKKKSKFSKAFCYLLHMLIGEPPLVSAFASKTMTNRVKDVIKSGEFDAALVFEMNAIQYFPSSSFYRLFVNIEDPQSIKLSRMARLSVWSLWQKTKLFMLARSTMRYENRILHKMAKVFLLSKADIIDMQKQGAYKNLAYVPYGVAQRDPPEIKNFENREEAIVFSGNMFHPPNIDGGLFLLNEIFPLILREYPSAILWIVGANPDSRIYESAEGFGKQVVITGRVDDVTDFIKRARVSICPVRLKVGVQTKILEALSCGTPVVTTSAGNGGVGGMTGTHLWVEDDARLLAKRVCDLLRGRDWNKISNEGRRLVADHFTWEGSVAQLEHHLETIATIL